MKKFLFCALIASLVAFVGCQNEELLKDNVVDKGGEKVVLTANIQGTADSRVALTSGVDGDDNPIVKVEWNESGEKFKLYGCSNGSYKTTPEMFSQQGGSNQFKGTLPVSDNGKFYAIYNGNQNTFEKIDYDLSIQKGVLNAAFVLMDAYTDLQSPITFEHQTAILKPRFKVGSNDINNTITKIVMNNVHHIDTSNYSNKKITITPLSGNETLNGDIYIHLPMLYIKGLNDDEPEEYPEGYTFAFTVTDKDNKEYTGSLTIPTGKSIEKGKLYTPKINMAKYEPIVCELPLSFSYNNYDSTPSFNKALREKTLNFNNATSIIFEAKSRRTGGTQICGSSAYAIVEENILYVYTAADEFMFNKSCYEMFSGMDRITEIDFGDFINTSQVENMGWMFYNCSSLESLELRNFNTSQVTRMDNMFSSCSSLESLDLSNFNTSQVTNMTSMFSGCSGLTRLDLSKFNTSKVMRMQYMFSGCSGLTSLVLSKFNTSSVTTMENMFSGCSGLTSLELSDFDTSSVTTMKNMFNGCSSLTSLDLSNFNTSSVTQMDRMFSNSGLTSLDLSDFDTSSVTTMEGMFSNSGLTSLDLSNFDTSSVTTMKNMFYGCSSLTSLDLSNFENSSVTIMSGMFSDCSCLTSLNLSSFNTSLVTDMSSMFRNCSSLVSLDLSNFNTSSVTTMGNMFNGCTSLTSLNVSNFDTSIKPSMNSMFKDCRNLTSLDLCSFTFPTVYGLYDIFSGAYALETVYVKDNEEKNKISAELRYLIAEAEVCPGHNESSPM